MEKRKQHAEAKEAKDQKEKEIEEQKLRAKEDDQIRMQRRDEEKRKQREAFDQVFAQHAAKREELREEEMRKKRDVEVQQKTDDVIAKRRAKRAAERERRKQRAEDDEVVGCRELIGKVLELLSDPEEADLMVTRPTTAGPSIAEISMDDHRNLLRLLNAHPGGGGSFGMTALHVLCLQPKVTKVIPFLDRHRTSQDDFRRTPLNVAAQSGALDAVRAIAATPTNIPELWTPDTFGNTPLHYVAHRGDVDLVTTLVGRGGAGRKIDTKNNADQTALHVCVTSRSATRMNCISVLLRHGASPFSVDVFGYPVIRDFFFPRW